MSFTKFLAATSPEAQSTLPLKNGSSLPILTLDGGMGTALELMGLTIADSPLWSASAIEKAPASIVNAHSDYLDAGADIITTNTYQASAEQFARAGTSSDTVPDLCRTAVRLAAEARRAYLAKSPMASRRPQIALSIGPYGATLPAAEEYDGMYPPPFGPNGVGQGREAENLSNVFNLTPDPTPAELEAEARAEDALYEWHLQRLRVYADAPEIWAEIDALAFETLPLVREARAIRRAVTELFHGQGRGSEGTVKPWWIVFTFPQGGFPQNQYVGGPPLSTDEVIEGVFGPLTTPVIGHELQGLLAPSGVGVNCTAPSYISSIVKQLSRSMSNFIKKAPDTGTTTELSSSSSPADAPWLVVYPNGGLTYQPITRNWREDGAERAGEHWVNELIESVQNGLELDATGNHGAIAPWGGVILGGCCRTGPEEIRHLCSSLAHLPSQQNV